MLSRQIKRFDAASAIASAARTLSTEQAALAALAEALDNGLSESFAEAVEMIARISGRVIVTGVGKSGHIGTKIAATLASTGTPAFFVHPVEANHGDLGMIAPDDAIIALSWSGESAELKGDIVLRGAGNRLEIWNAQEFKKYMARPFEYGAEKRAIIDQARSMMKDEDPGWGL